MRFDCRSRSRILDDNGGMESWSFSSVLIELVSGSDVIDAFVYPGSSVVVPKKLESLYQKCVHVIIRMMEDMEDQCGLWTHFSCLTP